MTDTEKILKLDKITKIIAWTLEVVFVVVFITLCIVVNSQRHTIERQQNIIENYGTIQQKNQN